MSIEYFSYCIVSCFDRKLPDVSRSAGMSLENWRPKIPFSRVEKEFQLADVPVEPRAGAAFANRIICFASSVAEGTVMITNMSDGYSSLAYAVTRHLCCSCSRFQISKERRSYSTNSVMLLVNGDDISLDIWGPVVLAVSKTGREVIDVRTSNEQQGRWAIGGVSRLMFIKRDGQWLITGN